MLRTNYAPDQKRPFQGLCVRDREGQTRSWKTGADWKKAAGGNTLHVGWGAGIENCWMDPTPDSPADSPLPTHHQQHPFPGSDPFLCSRWNPSALLISFSASFPNKIDREPRGHHIVFKDGRLIWREEGSGGSPDWVAAWGRGPAGLSRWATLARPVE